MTAPPFELPVNAPRACPACGGPWSYGYIVSRLPTQLGCRRAKVYRWALECRNDGCGLGYFVGSEITPEEVEGLELIDREKRKQEVIGMTDEREDPGAEKRWSRKYDCCRDCGSSENEHRALGLCVKCYANHERASTLDQFRSGKRKPSTRKTRTKAGSDVIDVTFSVRLSDLSPELRQEIKAEVADKLADKLAEKALAQL